MYAKEFQADDQADKTQTTAYADAEQQYVGAAVTA
jgi:hypothetical protein